MADLLIVVVVVEDAAHTMHVVPERHAERLCVERFASELLVRQVANRAESVVNERRRIRVVALEERETLRAPSKVCNVEDLVLLHVKVDVIQIAELRRKLLLETDKRIVHVVEGDDKAEHLHSVALVVRGGRRVHVHLPRRRVALSGGKVLKLPTHRHLRQPIVYHSLSKHATKGNDDNCVLTDPMRNVLTKSCVRSSSPSNGADGIGLLDMVSLKDPLDEQKGTKRAYR